MTNMEEHYIVERNENNSNYQLSNMIDTLKYSEEFKKAGFDSKQSKILANTLAKTTDKIISANREKEQVTKRDIKKIEKDTNDLIKKIKKNKDYFVSKKDLILLESLQFDGIKISKKYQNLFQFYQSDIPTDIQLLINNNEVGLILLRFVEIIGEDELENLGSDTLYFIVSVLNQLNIDPIRNNIILKVLPLKV